MSIGLPLRKDFNALKLRRIARGTKDANQARRALALATIYDGGSRAAAAATDTDISDAPVRASTCSGGDIAPRSPCAS
jgi:hypothetical protein